ncbi:PREDICTED: uncharacterized protein LOC105458720, partial [Wasmannia auropunctata]|uniref:uncharacterized protein LOC105458720 n=1 Tax=Wasmannia auropunctata TaxID=64793 RepID=UPI0005ED60BB
MADNRVKFLVQKRTSVKSQITSLVNLLDKGGLDNATLKLRIARLTVLYHAYEEHNDELALLDSSDGHQAEFTNIQERFYSLAGRIENILNAADLSTASTSGMSNETRVTDGENVTPIAKRRVKLPQAPLPTFDGSYEGWLTFKNAFRDMIDSREDLSDIDKLHYLKSALNGEAANKIKIFAAD